MLTQASSFRPISMYAALCPSLPVRPLSKEITMSQAYQNMCAGMYKVHPLSYHTPAQDMKNHIL